jgi:threonine dehydrogenase-like Zn-dependent dehydrogenase
MSDTRARAFWIAAPGRGEIRDEAVALPGPDDVLVRSLFSAVSRGTETLVFLGRVPESEHRRMRAPFQAGEFPAPVKYGYASVGSVERGPDALVGRTVFVLHPHQTRFVVPASAAYLVPDAVPPARAVLAANLETALNGVWDARLLPGDRVTVIGAGAVGCLTAWLAGRVPGCAVELVDVNSGRADIARALGVDFAEPGRAASDRDLVIHASGSPDGLRLALEIAGFESNVVEMSWFGDRSAALALGGAFHARRLRLVSSQVGTVAAPQRTRWSTRRRLELALELLDAPALDHLLTGESALDDLPTVMATLASSPGDAICHRIRYA